MMVMKAVALYHPQSDHGRRVEDYARDYKRRGGERQIELVSLETREGAEQARLYDVTSYPALLIVASGGQLQKLWQGGLPLMNEVDAYYLQNPA